MENAHDLKSRFRKIRNFPKQGMTFFDITPLLRDSTVFHTIIECMASHYSSNDLQFAGIAAPESRGFIFGSALAAALGVGFIPIRKPGKLPHHVTRQDYDLEYGTDAIEIHSDAVNPGDRILLVDDILATGGTARASAQLIEKQGGEVASMAFLAELLYLPGRSALAKYDVYSLVQFDKNDLR